ncbi:P-loop containing nucleoside triphosphate hydrolase protein [Suillus fuscotomentosus]|uniref:26S proteasome regulatory subunit 6B homolog n=1 Tax=Suillus fuscotomentosus TaxID=1912939 RepID=A0AAD4DRP8_9AGAM|nr:P-loop containing nucleoside triphosphate hydrolase protein [Suillus fuscotomentosus]KAG1891661.1 P-loop containing nucleoside triphosphate hydrolase protein [Suillus fuscotomentosus]
MTFAFDSFNIEDLHNVDQGVIDNLLPLMRYHQHSWHFAIGLGDDHVSRGVSPDHPILRETLEQMNTLLRDVIASMDDDTLTTLEDQEMDKTGNHGGDKVLEAMLAIWIYGKVPLSLPDSTIPEAILPIITFPEATVPHSHVDLVPTTSLLLGLPIPFNNLRTVIPELFSWDSDVRLVKLWSGFSRGEPSYADVPGQHYMVMDFDCILQFQKIFRGCLEESVKLSLTHPELYEEMGIKPPKGTILYGVAGTGKTLFAKAVTKQTSATFLCMVGSELIQKYLGDGPKLVRALFRIAEGHAPSIVFIDEIDAIGTKRYDSTSGGNHEIQRTMFELINQLDGFNTRGDIEVIMATNKIETLDPALI